MIVLVFPWYISTFIHTSSYNWVWVSSLFMVFFFFGSHIWLHFSFDVLSLFTLVMSLVFALVLSYHPSTLCVFTSNFYTIPLIPLRPFKSFILIFFIWANLFMWMVVYLCSTFIGSLFFFIDINLLIHLVIRIIEDLWSPWS